MRRNAVLAALVTFAAIGGWLAVGLGAATVTTDTANFSAVGSDELANQTLGVDSGTQSLYVSLDNDTANATEPANVTVYEVVNGSETQVDTVQISAASGSIETYEFASLDTQNVSEYRVTVTGNASDIESAAVDIGTIEKVSGGGGLLGGSSSSLGAGGIAAIVVVGYLFLKD